MERIVAVKRLRKMLGKNFGYQINPKAPSKEEREQALALQKGLNEHYKNRVEAMEVRRKFLLDHDTEFQALLSEVKTARTAKENNSSKIYSSKISVGLSTSLFFHIKASGDSWEEIFEELAKKR